MDGTLVDSNSTVDVMWNTFAVECGLDPLEVRTYAHGVPSTSTLRRFMPADQSFDAWFARIAAWESETFGHVAEIPGALDLVRSLPADAWSVVTSALRDAARIRLEGVGFPSPRVLIGADDVAHGKPHPEGFLTAAAAMGVDVSGCVVFEDSPAGLEAALAAGARAVVVGELDAAVTRGLPRLLSWEGVTAFRRADGRLQIDGIPTPG